MTLSDILLRSQISAQPHQKTYSYSNIQKPTRELLGLSDLNGRSPSNPSPQGSGNPAEQEAGRLRDRRDGGHQHSGSMNTGTPSTRGSHVQRLHGLQHMESQHRQEVDMSPILIQKLSLIGNCLQRKNNFYQQSLTGYTSHS